MVQQPGIDHHQRQVARDGQFHKIAQGGRRQMVERGLAGFGQIDRLGLAPQGARLDPHHVEQVGHEPVESLGLAARTGKGQGLVGIARTQRAQGAQNGRERGAQVVADRRKQRPAQPLAFLHAAQREVFLLQRHPRERQPRLGKQAFHQRHLFAMERAVDVRAAHPHDRKRPGGPRHGQEQPFRSGRHEAARPDRPPAFKRPLRGGGLKQVEPLVCAAPADQHQPSRPVRGHDHDPQPEHLVDLFGQKRPERLAPGHRHEPPGKAHQQGVAPGARLGQLGLFAQLAGHVAAHQRHPEQDHQRDEMRRVGHRECETGRNKEEVIGQCRKHPGQQPRPHPQPDRREHHRHQIEQPDIGNARPRKQDQPDQRDQHHQRDTGHQTGGRCVPVRLPLIHHATKRGQPAHAREGCQRKRTGSRDKWGSEPGARQKARHEDPHEAGREAPRKECVNSVAKRHEAA